MRGGGHSAEVRPLGAEAGTLPELQDFSHVSRHLQLARPKAAPPRLPILISQPHFYSLQLPKHSQVILIFFFNFN